MRLSRRGAALIAQFEGFVPRPYDDAAGHATIGFGHLLHKGAVTAADVARWGTISRERGLKLLMEDAREAERAVREAIHVPLRQAQFDALVSFAFNVGTGAFASSTLVRKLNAGDARGAGDELLRWANAGGRVLEGLLRRRQAERALFESAGSAPESPLTASERRWVQESRAAGTSARRRAALRRRMTAARQRIWHAARSSGWGLHNRRARYRILLERTR
jgi:lysozyme